MPQFIMTQYIKIHLHLHVGSIEKLKYKKARLNKITIDHRFKIQIKTATDREMKKPHESQGSIFSSS